MTINLNIEEYVQYLDEQIKHHGMELEKHMNAREVLLRHAKRMAVPVHREAPALAKPKGKSSPNRVAWADIKVRILEAMADVNPGEMWAGDFIRLILGDRPHNKPDRDRIYGVLKELRDRKHVKLNKDNSYTLLPDHNTHEEVAA